MEELSSAAAGGVWAAGVLDAADEELVAGPADLGDGGLLRKHRDAHEPAFTVLGLEGARLEQARLFHRVQEPGLLELRASRDDPVEDDDDVRLDEEELPDETLHLLVAVGLRGVAASVREEVVAGVGEHVAGVPAPGVGRPVA